MIEMSSWVLLFWHIFSRILYTLSTQPVLRGMLSMDILVFTFCCIVSQQAVSRYLGSQCFCCMLGSIMHLTNEYLVNVYTMKVNFWKDRLEICKNCSKYTPFGLATDFFFFPPMSPVIIVSKNGTIIWDAWLYASVKPAILVDPQFKMWLLLIPSASRVLLST